MQNRPGELARVTEALANHAVNIRAIASEGGHSAPFLRVVTNDEETTHKALKLAGLRYEENDILTTSLLDRPGELAKIAKRLARAGVNVESVYILGTRDGRTELAFVVDDRDRAGRAIK